MRVALKDLRLDQLTVVHAGEGAFPLGGRIRAVALEKISEEVDRLA